MTEKLSKREFVDENPYLVYASEKDTAYNGSGGSGSIPIASANALGGVKVGDGLSITEEGVLSASGGVTVFEITIEDDTPTIDASYNDIANANYAVFKLIDESESEVSCLSNYAYQFTNNEYTLVLPFGEGTTMQFVASTPDAKLTFTS